MKNVIFKNIVTVNRSKEKFGKRQVKRSVSFLIVAAMLCACAPFAGRETMGEYVDDAGITASVKNKIFQDPALKMFQIHVETFQNTVQLSGFVDSVTEAAKAERLARNVQGVRNVQNTLVVRKHP